MNLQKVMCIALSALLSGCGGFVYIPKGHQGTASTVTYLKIIKNQDVTNPVAATDGPGTAPSAGIIETDNSSTTTNAGSVVTVATTPSVTVHGINGQDTTVSSQDTECTYIAPPSISAMPIIPTLTSIDRANLGTVETKLVDYILILRQYITTNTIANDLFYTTYQSRCKPKSASLISPPPDSK